MTTSVPPTPEHVAALSRLMTLSPAPQYYGDLAQAILNSDDPAVHAAMLDALTRHGALTEETATRPRWVDTGRPIPATHARVLDDLDATVHELVWEPLRRLVTRWEVAS